MENKSPKLIIGIILLIIAVIVQLTNITSYWMAIAIAAIGLILIISRSSDSANKKETPVVETEEPSIVEEVAEPAEVPAPIEEDNDEEDIVEEDKEEVGIEEEKKF